jgi:hypothetical protein
MHRKPGHSQREIDLQIDHIRGLVLIRRMLADRGATQSELGECDAVIAGCRLQLADLALRTRARPSVAA